MQHRRTPAPASRGLQGRGRREKEAPPGMSAGLVRQQQKTSIEAREDEDAGAEAYRARSSTVDVPLALMHCDGHVMNIKPSSDAPCPQTLRLSLQPHTLLPLISDFKTCPVRSNKKCCAVRK